MFRVVCIETEGNFESCEMNILRKGNIYHVVSEKQVRGYITQRGKRAEDGLYYELIETGHFIYHSSLFIKINDDEQKDETEFERNYQHQKTNPI